MHIPKLAAIGTVTALLSALGSPAFADTVAPTVQQTGANVNATSTAVSTSAVNGTAASGVVGNAGLNMTSGSVNQQDNALVIDANPAATTITGTLSQTGAAGTIKELGNSGESSTIGGSAASNVTGNAGVNSAAGTANQQLNALVTAQGTAGAISNGAGSTQSGGGSTVLTNALSVAPPAPSCSQGVFSANCSDNSSVQGAAGTNVSGNLGLNSAAGVLNAQMNAMYVTSGTNATPSAIDQTHTQTSNAGGTATVFGHAQTENAEIVGSAGNTTSGNVGINSAAGNGNLQANLTTVVAGITGGGGNGGTLPIGQTMTQSIGSSSGATAVTAGVLNFAPFVSTITSGESLTGVAGLNSGAGIQNGQINAAALLAGSSAGTPQLTQSLSQRTQRLSSHEQSVDDLSTVGPGVGANARGIVGANSAGGVQNLQSNEAMLVSATASGSASYGQSPSQTITGGSVSQGVQLNVSSVQGGTGASGIVSVNSAGGTANQQQNTSVLLANLAGNATISQGASAPGAGQSISGFNGTQGSGSPNGITNYDNQSTINGTAGASASGIVQMNSAAGIGNQQGNNAMFFPSSTIGATGGSSAQHLSQSSAGTATLNGTLSTSDITDAGNGASGITAFNSTSGIGNQQANDMVFSAGGGTVSSVTADAGQSLGTSSVTQTGGSNKATLGGNAFNSASGLAAANTSSGAFNQQGNILQLSDANLGAVTPSIGQSSSGLTVTSSAPNTATIGANAFGSFHGTAGGNVASGAANQQVNNVQMLGH